MNLGTVVVVLLAVLVGGAVVALLKGGRFDGSAKIGNAKLGVGAGRKPPPPPGEARIEGSKARRDALAIGPRAIIKDSEAERDLIAQAGELSDPKA